LREAPLAVSQPSATVNGWVTSHASYDPATTRQHQQAYRTTNEIHNGRINTQSSQNSVGLTKAAQVTHQGQHHRRVVSTALHASQMMLLPPIDNHDQVQTISSGVQGNQGGQQTLAPPKQDTNRKAKSPRLNKPAAASGEQSHPSSNINRMDRVVVLKKSQVLIASKTKPSKKQQMSTRKQGKLQRDASSSVCNAVSNEPRIDPTSCGGEATATGQQSHRRKARHHQRRRSRYANAEQAFETTVMMMSTVQNPE